MPEYRYVWDRWPQFFRGRAELLTFLKRKERFLERLVLKNASQGSALGERTSTAIANSRVVS
jgi:hypothetical protein